MSGNMFTTGFRKFSLTLFVLIAIIFSTDLCFRLLNQRSDFAVIGGAVGLVFTYWIAFKIVFERIFKIFKGGK